jgi:hypothetical protein
LWSKNQGAKPRKKLSLGPLKKVEKNFQKLKKVQKTVQKRPNSGIPAMTVLPVRAASGALHAINLRACVLHGHKDVSD